MAKVNQRYPTVENLTMNPKQIMHRWSRFVQTLLPHTHAYQGQGLATFSFGLACARHSHLSRVCAHVPTSVQPPSVLRRLKRLLHNPRLDVEALCDQMARWLGRWNHPGARLVLLLDETPHHNTWRVLKVSVCYKKRALPLVWRTDALAGRPHRARVLEVLHHAAALVARFCPQAQVVLLADRGLCWPALIDLCGHNGWHFLLRAQSHTRFVAQGAQGAAQRMGELVKGPGQWWCGSGRAFAKAGWRGVNVVACWRCGAQDPWIVVSDLPASLHLVRWYARRMWQEQSFRDEKSHGFAWQESHLQSAQAVHRLLLLIALAHLWLMLLGTLALGPQWRGRLGLTSRQQRARYSVCRHGWILLSWCLHNHTLPPCHLRFNPP
jgi:hypothetical protein